ncbi:MAG: N-acetylgalactosamine-6-sulfatase [Cyclobacteriaceae bacterium]|nr:MAG: N-acetylgalactosamine-6-sulfatase [Cyclobacteriaceae bacterium]
MQISTNPDKALVFCFLLILAPSYLVGNNDSTDKVEPPNIIVIFSDDQAQWTVGAYGNKDVSTPNMDRLAVEGMMFTNGFTKPVCSPSRAMLLTGLYSHRVGIPDYILPADQSTRGLPVGTPTIASILKKKGYVTGLIGKWHLGYGERYYPEKYGFDVADVYRYNAPGETTGLDDIDNIIRGKRVSKFIEDPENGDILFERAVEYIRKNQNNRFFLYLSTYKPHLPWIVPDRDHNVYKDKEISLPDISNFSGITRETVNKTNLERVMKEYYAAVTNTDRNLGKVLDELDALGLAKNTLIFYIGDNGFMVGQHGMLGKGNARVMYIREGAHKYGDYLGREYGTAPNMLDNSVLVPFMVKWPGVIEPGSVNKNLVSTIDVLPTIMDIVGIESDLNVDGKSMVPLLKGEETNWRKYYCDTYDMIHLGDNGEQPHMRMLRSDKWKYITYEDEMGRPLDNGTRNQLFNLDTDPEELVNLYDKEEYDETIKFLESSLRNWMFESQYSLSYK